jgi:2-isopropylmalate synthase
VGSGQLARITHVSRLLDEILNRAPARHAPYVGPSAFAHKGGLHSSAVLKDPTTYEHVKPESVGNVRVIPVSDQSGRANVLARLKEVGIALEPRDPRVSRLLEDIKQREFQGYAYDGAEASFELLARRALGQVPDYFTVDSYRVSVERRRDGHEFVSESEAVVRLKVAGKKIHSVGSGNGPVNALDAALRKDLGKYSSHLSDLRLVDFKVRILNAGIEGGGTEAVTRVMVESADGKGNRWSTVGLSENIVDASFEALTDSITYKLLRDGAQVG